MKPMRSIAQLRVPSQQASSKPPLGPAIGQLGVPIMDFCNLFNKLCSEQQIKSGVLVSCYLYLYKDFSFDVSVNKVGLSFFLKTSWYDALMYDKKKLSTHKGRVQALLFGSFHRRKRSKQKKHIFLWISSYALYDLSFLYYSSFMSSSNTSFYSFYKTVFGFIKSNGYLVFSSNMVSVDKKKHFILYSVSSSFPLFPKLYLV